MIRGSTNPNAHSLHRNNISSYFDSEHYSTLDYIKHRNRLNEADANNKDVCIFLTENTDTKYADNYVSTPEDNIKERELQTRRFGLRRPLSPSLTVDDIREQSVWHEEFADKPYSTVMSRSGPMQYTECFPLLMARSSNAEDKDSTKVQTETRRMSVVTTNYTTGKIKLKGVSSDEDNITLSVFPILHKDLPSSSEDEDDIEDDETGPPPVPMYRRMTIAPASNNTDIKAGWNSVRRNMSIVAPLAKAMGRQGPRVTRRRSMDSNAISGEHFRALQIIRERMRNTTMEEEEEEEDDGPLTEEDAYHLKHAESTMLHLDKNLNTLEKFLSKIDSTLDKDDETCGISSDNNLQSTFSPAEDNDDCQSSESDNDDSTFW